MRKRTVYIYVPETRPLDSLTQLVQLPAQPTTAFSPLRPRRRARQSMKSYCTLSNHPRLSRQGHAQSEVMLLNDVHVPHTLLFVVRAMRTPPYAFRHAVLAFVRG